MRRWLDDLMPLVEDRDVLGVEGFASHHRPLADAAPAYEIFQKKQDDAFKVIFTPGAG